MAAPRATWLGWLALAGAVGCDDGRATPADRLRDAYAPGRAVTVGGFAWEIALALRDDVVYAAGIDRLVRIERTTGGAVELLASDEGATLGLIAADDRDVFVVTRRPGVGDGVVRVAKGGGPAAPIFAAARTTVAAIAARDGVLYAITDEEMGQPPTTWRRTLVAIPAAGGEAAVLAELPREPLAAFVAARDGLFVGSAVAGGTVARVPYAGGEPAPVQQSERVPFHLASDATGVYWNLGASVPGLGERATLFFLPDGGAEPAALSANATRGAFAVNELGCYWVDRAGHAIRAVTREALDVDAFALLDTDHAPMAIAADDRALVYTTDDGDNDLADLEVHLVPRNGL